MNATRAITAIFFWLGLSAGAFAQVTPIPDNATFASAVRDCLIDSPITGECTNWADVGIYGTMPNWDTSQVTSMNRAFLYQTLFNGDISAWDTNRVVDMAFMFYEAHNFNQNISSWDTSSVVNMQTMFGVARAFNQNIGSWNTSNVTNMSQMFYDCLTSAPVGQV